MESGEIVRVINHGTMPLTMTYSSRDYVVLPDKEQAVPFDCMVLYFGDPRAMANIYSKKDAYGVHTWIPDRDTEVRRLRIKWGIKDGDSRFIPIPGMENIQFYDFEGNRIFTVVDDPLGEQINVQPQTVSEVQLLRDQIISLQAKQDQMEAAMRPSPVDAEIAASAGETLEDQAVEHFSTPPQSVNVMGPASSDPDDIPEDTSTSDYTGSESSHSRSVTDTTGTKVGLRYVPPDE